MKQINYFFFTIVNNQFSHAKPMCSTSTPKPSVLGCLLPVLQLVFHFFTIPPEACTVLLVWRAKKRSSIVLSLPTWPLQRRPKNLDSGRIQEPTLYMVWGFRLRVNCRRWENWNICIKCRLHKQKQQMSFNILLEQIFTIIVKLWGEWKVVKVIK